MADLKPSRYQMVVRCPACSHAQIEPKLAISTRCRGCGAHIEFHKKKPVIREAPEGPRVTQSIAGKAAEPVATPPPTQKLPTLQRQAGAPASLAKITPPPPPAPFTDPTVGSAAQPVAIEPAAPIEPLAPTGSPAPTWAAPEPEAPNVEECLPLAPPEAISEEAAEKELSSLETILAPSAPTLGIAAPTLAPLADAIASTRSEPQAPPPTPGESAASTAEVDRTEEAAPEFTPSRYTAPAPPPQTSSAPSLLKRLIKRDPERRDVVCPSCGHESQAPFAAFATNCPKCGVYIPLKDYEIQERWNARIETRGNVAVTKKGHFGGPSITCNHLTLDGPCNGDINCSGDLIVRAKIELPGKIRCDRCVVEKGAKVKFLQTIQAREVVIAGEAKANVDVSGTFTLEKSGSLQGDVVAARLAIRPGGKHQGSIRTRNL